MLPYHEVHRLHDAYTELLDGGDYDRWLELFTADGTLTIGETVHCGHDGLRRFLQARRPHPGRHLTGPAIFVESAPGCCVVEANFIAVKPATSGLDVVATGRYRDELRDEGGTWRIAARRIQIGGRQ